MESKKVSIIIPVYNVEKYISKCLESVITQTYTNLEILVNNDGSTDNSYQICKEYALIDSRIKLFSQENKGLSAARNAMLDKVTGYYILFVDSDDIIAPEHVERLVKIIEENNADGAACSYFGGRKEKVFPKRKKSRLIRYSGEQFADKITWILGYRCFAWGRLIKSSFWNGISFPEGLIFEDMFTLPKVVMKLDSIVYTKEKLYFYRKRLTGISHAPFSLKRTDELDGYIFFTRLGMDNGYVPLVRNGALFFILVYLKFKATMLIKKIDTSTYTEKYKPYFKVYLRMLLTGKYNHNDLIYKKLIPLR